MKIALLYPPPWKISGGSDSTYPPGEGPPAGLDASAVENGDFLQAPYGLLSLGAQALKAGFRTKVINLSNFSWPAVERLIPRLGADLFGLSCLTANRRGTAMLARLIRAAHPGAHIVAGGPHVSALPLETLEHYPAIDTVVIGEGEATFMEIAHALQAGKTPRGLSGTAWRTPGGGCTGPPRAQIPDLDTLAPPPDYFDTGTLLTSRGCPMRCTFCGSHTMWGRRVRFHSAGYVLHMLETAVNRHGRRVIAFKDDTFTADRKRVLAICNGIIDRGLEFIWSCDTRVDCLDDTLLGAMRRAGCVRISLGVESASETILKNIRKHLSLTRLLELTRSIKTFGIGLRYYMMVGNRGETVDTFRRSLAFIERARPNQFVFSQLHLYPGTEEFDIFASHGLVTPDIFFTRNFFCLTCFAGSPEDEQAIRSTLAGMPGVQDCWAYGVAERRQILERRPETALLHADLCRAYLRENNPDAAETHLQRAVSLGYCLPGMAGNLKACIAAQRDDAAGAARHLARALGHAPPAVVVRNQGRIDAWLNAADRQERGPLHLSPGDGYENECICHQPAFPGRIGCSAGPAGDPSPPFEIF
jgi:radical SAM superfamily enzyme YgiQ (UPF0313 family)